MSQLDRALIRAYTTETPSRTPDVAAQQLEDVMSKPEPSPSSPVAPLRAVPRKPTLSELQHWKNQGIRIDLPGSPLVGSYDSSPPSTAEAAPAPASNQPDEFALAAQNTAAVAEALDRLLARAGSKRKPAPVASAEPRSAAPSEAETATELPSPTIEIQPIANGQWQSEPTPIETATDGASYQFVAVTPQSTAEAKPALKSVLRDETASIEATPPSRLYRQRRITQPKWEVESLTWPEEIDMILDQCHDEWQTLAKGISAKSKSMALVSLGDECGCTTMTLCLAKLMAEQGRNVLLIDEGHGPESLTVRLGLEEGFPPQTQRPIESLYEATIQVADQPIAILPAGYRRQADLSPAQLQQFSHDFDVILWDGGDRPEAWHRLSLVHQVLVVRDARGTHDHELGQILPKLTARKINVVGVADNFWR